jgi:hypothetical protein
VLGALTTLAVIALTFEYVGTGGGTGSTAGASTVNFVCGGVTGDHAGDIGGAALDSAGLLGKLSLVTGGGPPQLPINVTATAPAQVNKSTTPFQVNFGVSVGVDPALGGLIQKFLNRSTIDIKNTSVTILADGVNQTIVGQIPDQTINVNAASSTSTFSAMITPTVSGRIHYRAVGAHVAIAINGSVLGQANIGTLQLVCASTGDNIVGSTVVQIPGAPQVADMHFQGHWGVNLFHLEDGHLIAPDDGNPIIPDSLALTSPIPIAHGLAATSQGWLGMLLGYQGYTDDVNMNVCAPARIVPEEPGSDESYTIDYNDFQYNRLLNAHLLGFQLKIGDTVKTISTSKDVNPLRVLGIPGQVDGSTPLSGDNIITLSSPSLSYFFRPAASVVQKTMESVVGAGNVTVTDAPAPDPATGIPAGYVITYTGALHEKAGPDISISRFFTHLPAEDAAAISALAQGAGQSSGPPPLTLDQLNTRLTTPGTPYFGDFSAWEQGVAALLSASLPNTIIDGLGGSAKLLDMIGNLFPKPPSSTQVSPAVATIPAHSTGPLCTPFSVNVVTPPVPMNVVLFLTQMANGGGGGTQVLSRQVCTRRVRVRVRVRSHGRTRYVTRYVTRVVACRR